MTRRLDPRTVPITVASDPAGVALTLGTETAIAPLTLEVIEGSQLPITAPSQATVNGETYEFAGWSDGGGRTHDITVGTAPATFTASFQPPPAALAVTPATLSFTATARRGESRGPDPVRGQHRRRDAFVHGELRRSMAVGVAG